MRRYLLVWRCIKKLRCDFRPFQKMFARLQTLAACSGQSLECLPAPPHLMPWDQILKNEEKRNHPRRQPRLVHHNQRDHGHDHHQSWKQTCIILQTPTNLIIANCLSTASPWHRFWVDLRLFWCKRKCSTYRFQIVQKLSFKTIMRDDFGVDACQKKINPWRLH